MRRLLQRLRGLLGWMTARDALDAGFTHHAWQYGCIPGYFAFEGEGCMFAAVWAPLEYLEMLLRPIWMLAWELSHDADDPPQFGFAVGRRIDMGGKT